MNIWVIGRSYPTKQNKMRGSFELEQAQILASHGHTVTYMAVILHPINKVKKWGLAQLEAGGVRVYTESIFFAPERMHIHPKHLLFKAWKKLFFLAEAEQGCPDIIHIHYPGMNGVPEMMLPYQKCGTKVVTTDHWSKTLTNTMDNFQRKQLIAFSDVADAILCVGEPLKKAIKEITKTDKEVLVVPNVVSSLFRPADDKKKQKNFCFIAVGRLASVKQMDQIASAFCEAFANNPQVTLLFVGDGTERKKIEQIIREKKMESRVQLVGTKTREQTAELVAHADALVCYSRLVTFGVPVIEAWASGIPTISSDCLGFLEYHRDGLGYVVPHNDLEQLKLAMVKLYQNKEQFDSEMISNFAHCTFGEEALYNQLMKVYSPTERRLF